MSRDAAIAQIDAVASSVSRETVERAVLAFFASYPATRAEDVQPRIDLLADDAVFEDPVGAPALVGKEKIAHFFRETAESGWVIHLASEQMIVCGNEAISLTKGTWGVAGTEPAQVQMVHNVVVDASGRITRVRIFFDQGTVA